MKLDPWLDAQRLAERLGQPGARLVVVLGAPAWCQKCRDYYPEFEARAAQAPAHESHVWLDLEEHLEFIGRFIPDDLPLRLVYEEGRLQAATVVGPDGQHEPVPPSQLHEPGIHARLCRVDWAS